jgi:hypothetical protein
MRLQYTVPVILSLIAVSAAAGQTRSVALDLRPVAGALSYASGQPTRQFGIEVGFGFPQLEQRITPRGSEFHDFNEFLHLAVFTRLTPTEKFESDLGVRVSVADLRVCMASDCWPGLFGGVYGSVFYGGGRWKIGSMLEAGRHHEPGEAGATVVNLSPLLLRVKF